MTEPRVPKPIHVLDCVKLGKDIGEVLTYLNIDVLYMHTYVVCVRIVISEKSTCITIIDVSENCSRSSLEE